MLGVTSQEGVTSARRVRRCVADLINVGLMSRKSNVTGRRCNVKYLKRHFEDAQSEFQIS